MRERSQLLLPLISGTRRRRKERAEAAMVYPRTLEDPFTTSSPPSVGRGSADAPLIYFCPPTLPQSTKERLARRAKEFDFSTSSPALLKPHPHRQRSISIMDRRHPSLPTERGGPPQFHFPQRLSLEQNPSTGSTESVDSIRTQIPLAYHLPPGYGVIPELGYNNTMGSLPYSGGAPKLNPTSNPYIPTTALASNVRTYTSTSLSSDSSNQTQGWSNNNAGQYSRDTSFSSGSSYPAQQMGSMQYQNLNQYVGMPQFQQQPHFREGEMMSAPAPAPITAASAFTTGPGLPSPQPSYGHHGQAEMHQTQYAMQQNQYNPHLGMPGQIGYYPSAAGLYPFAPVPSASPAMSYTTIGSSPIQNYHATIYPDSQGITQAWGSLYGPGVTGMYNGSQYGGGGGNFDGGSYVTQQRGSYAGSSSYSQDQNSYKGKHNKHNKVKGKGKSQQTPVQPPASSGKSTKVVVEDRNVENQSQASPRHSLASEDTKANSVDDAVTPGPKPRALNGECKSEPRFIETPILRSRRGQSISNAIATDPVRKSSVASWLETTPTSNHLSLEQASETIKRHQSPPKMLSLLTHGGGGGSSSGSNTLNPLNENDPFVTRRLGPFGQSGSMNAPGPYRGNLLGHPGMSKQLARLTRNGSGKPTLEEALAPQNLPFVEYCRLAKGDEYGVIKIKNIPYSVNRPEVLAFLGRNARIVSEQDSEPVHIVMERVTSKTLDCYVEFVNFNEAVSAVNRYETNRNGGRSGRLGQRHVEVELSSQEALMQDLFPKAKNVTWNGSRPIIHPKDPNDIYNSGFQGFVSREELVMLVKHVEAPQRSPFSKECPQRPFECLISTLIKYPWYMVDHITIQDRALVHKATIELLTLLVDRVKANCEDVNLTTMLLKRVWKAALRCPVFSPVMKDDIVYIVGIDLQTAKDYNVPPFAADWQHIYTIGIKAGTPTDVVLWYIAQIREATDSRKPKLSLAEQAASGDGAKKPCVFGDIKSYINHDKKKLFKMTLGEAAKAEWSAIEKLLHISLGPPALEG